MSGLHFKIFDFPPERTDSKYFVQPDTTQSYKISFLVFPCIFQSFYLFPKSCCQLSIDLEMYFSIKWDSFNCLLSQWWPSSSPPKQFPLLLRKETIEIQFENTSNFRIKWKSLTRFYRNCSWNWTFQIHWKLLDPRIWANKNRIIIFVAPEGSNSFIKKLCDQFWQQKWTLKGLLSLELS